MSKANGNEYVQWLDQLWGRRLAVHAQSRTVLSIGILLWPAFPLMSLAGIVESLRHAGDFGDMSRQIEGRWEIIGTPGHSVHSSCGIPVRATTDYLNPVEFDWLFIIGGLLSQMDNAPLEHGRYLRAAHRLGVGVAGLCTGSFILAREQLLSGQVACVHPFHRRDFETAFPGHRMTTSNDFVLADRIATIPGGVSVLSFMAHLIGHYFGSDRAAKVIHQLSIPDHKGLSEFDRGIVHPHREIPDTRIQRAIVMMDAAVGGKLSVAELARQLGMSERHFGRLFKQMIGMHPSEYLGRLRLRYALWLLRHSTKPITTVAYEAGFFSPAHLATTCVKRLGKNPTAIRRDGL